jgi:hypothetical protein
MLLLASSLLLSSPGHRYTNAMLRTASVDHDLARVKRRIERALRSQTAAGPDVPPVALPQVTR